MNGHAGPRRQPPRPFLLRRHLTREHARRRLLGLRGLRPALLQIAPRWLLEWWVGTLPLDALVHVWDATLSNARQNGSPSSISLQAPRS